jgi:DNA-binding MarR family transcriptional regulator
MNYTIPSKTIFYSIEKAIKAYRKFAQQKYSQIIEDLTVDQTLILQFLSRKENLSQKELAELLLKEDASITRMVESLVKKKYLVRKKDSNDRRKSILKITDKGLNSLNALEAVVISNRQKALNSITEDELAQVTTILNKIITNCTTTTK